MCHIQMASIRRNLIKQLGSYYVFNNNMQDHLSNASCQNIIEDKITGILTSTVCNTCLPWSLKKYFCCVNPEILKLGSLKHQYNFHLKTWESVKKRRSISFYPWTKKKKTKQKAKQVYSIVIQMLSISQANTMRIKAWKSSAQRPYLLERSLLSL